jgi:hypothetical protein
LLDLVDLNTLQEGEVGLEVIKPSATLSAV